MVKAPAKVRPSSAVSGKEGLTPSVPARSIGGIGRYSFVLEDFLRVLGVDTDAGPFP